MNTFRVLLPALGASLALAAGGPGEKLAFQPEPGTQLTKSYAMAIEFSLDDISLIVDGQDVGQMLGQLEMNFEQDVRIQVTDTYKAVADGRPTELLRTFDELAATGHVDVTPAEMEMPEFTSSSTLEGKTVLFRWDEEAGEYERSFHEDSGDEELLEGIEEDMDLRVFLPASEVSKDESWSVDLADLRSVMSPGGNLRMLPEGIDVDMKSMEAFEELLEFEDLLEGECKCTFKGVREENGARVAEIAVELEVGTTQDLSEFLEEVIHTAIEASGADEAVDLTVDTADFNLDFEGTGVLLWDLGAGRVHSFQISGDATVDIDLAVSVEAQGESHDLDASLELLGTLSEEVAVKE
jgi:hypothetical protein